MISRLVSCVVSACLVLAAQSARAEWAATALVSELKLAVIDLTPDDSTAAAFYYRRADTGSYSFLNLNGTRQYFSAQSEYFPVPPDMSVAAARDGARIALEFLPALFSTRSEAAGNSGTMDVIGEDAQVFTGSTLWLGIAPHTELHVSTVYTGSLDRTGLESGLLRAYSWASLSAYVNDDSFSDASRLDANGDDMDQYLGRELTLVLRNDGDTLLDVRIRSSQNVGVALASPVPEPSGFAMLMAGSIMLLPFLRRRRGDAARRSSH